MSLNKKGFTLIESLFAFSIFTTVIILLVSLYVIKFKNKHQSQSRIRNLSVKETTNRIYT